MSALIIVILSLAAIGTSVISAVVGMAGGIVLLSLMTFFVSWQVLVPVHGMVQLASNGSRALFLRKDIDFGIVIPFVLGTPIGAVLAVYFVKSLPSENVPLLLVAALIFYTLFKPKKLPPLKIPLWGFSVLGVAAAFMALLAGATGPLLAPFFLRDDLTKEQIIASKATSQIAVHIVKIPSFLFLGFNYSEYALLMACMILASILGTRLGILVLGKVNEKIFRRIYSVALFVAGVRILFKIFY